MATNASNTRLELICFQIKSGHYCERAEVNRHRQGVAVPRHDLLPTRHRDSKYKYHTPSACYDAREAAAAVVLYDRRRRRRDGASVDAGCVLCHWDSKSAPEHAELATARTAIPYSSTLQLATRRRYLISPHGDGGDTLVVSFAVTTAGTRPRRLCALAPCLNARIRASSLNRRPTARVRMHMAAAAAVPGNVTTSLERFLPADMMPLRVTSQAWIPVSRIPRSQTAARGDYRTLHRRCAHADPHPRCGWGIFLHSARGSKRSTSPCPSLLRFGSALAAGGTPIRFAATLWTCPSRDSLTVNVTGLAPRLNVSTRASSLNRAPHRDRASWNAPNEFDTQVGLPPPPSLEHTMPLARACQASHPSPAHPSLARGGYRTQHRICDPLPKVHKTRIGSTFQMCRGISPPQHTWKEAQYLHDQLLARPHWDPRRRLPRPPLTTSDSGSIPLHCFGSALAAGGTSMRFAATCPRIRRDRSRDEDSKSLHHGSNWGGRASGGGDLRYLRTRIGVTAAAGAGAGAGVGAVACGWRKEREQQGRRVAREREFGIEEGGMRMARLLVSRSPAHGSTRTWRSIRHRVCWGDGGRRKETAGDRDYMPWTALWRPLGGASLRSSTHLRPTNARSTTAQIGAAVLDSAPFARGHAGLRTRGPDCLHARERLLPAPAPFLRVGVAVADGRAAHRDSDLLPSILVVATPQYTMPIALLVLPGFPNSFLRLICPLFVTAACPFFFAHSGWRDNVALERRGHGRGIRFMEPGSVTAKKKKTSPSRKRTGRVRIAKKKETERCRVASAARRRDMSSFIKRWTNGRMFAAV
ncbi:hypothetical protein K438DRAFT_1763273 [Mycena galopus ATCC 62051]|nr:hypothetical protein K438DRAFT_1763273 [Mycena galopus ATCC 62051]